MFKLLNDSGRLHALKFTNSPESLTCFPSRDCLKILHAAFCRITMQPPLFELKLKTIPLLHRRDRFVFTRKFLK